MRNISFTGFKNVGAYSVRLPFNKCAYVVNMELDNNENPDLDSFKNILAKYPNGIDNKFLSVLCTDFDNESINLNFNRVDLTDENLGVYEKVVKLLKRVKQSKDFKTEDGYLKTKKALDLLGITKAVSNLSLNETNEQLSVIHNGQNVRNCTDKMYTVITGMVEDYFA